MARGLLYNPSNDGALACHTACYTPPRIARVLERDLARLPLWWAESGDVVLTEGADLSGVDRCMPWGWSRDAVRRFVDAGVPPGRLPDDDKIERIRRLSHRRISVEVNRQLAKLLPDMKFPPPSVEICNVDNIPTDTDLFVKQPWSCSGRGVHRYAAGRLADNARRKIADMIARSGSVTVERALDRVQDFAALFYSDGAGRVEFRGLSVFDASPSGAYIGNVVASEEELRARIAQWVDMCSVDQLLLGLESVLGDLISDAYAGWLGVDMMVYRDGAGCAVAPCVEVNLRMTMGVVAHLIRSRAELTPYMPGVLMVIPAAGSQADDLVLASGSEVAAVVRRSAQNVLST